jgi:uncharacterized protein YjiS (DUF1127 family)
MREGADAMISISHARPFRPVLPTFGAMVATVERLAERRRQRRALLALDDRMLRDIGLSTADAWQEGSKSFWRP